MSVEESSIEENAQVEVASRLGFHLSMVLTEYERNILRDLLAEAAAQSLNHSAKIALEKMLDGVQSATQTTIPKATPEIGAIESTGKHKGETYGGTWTKEHGGDYKPIWFLAAPKSMNHFNAASWATEHGAGLPTRNQGDYLTTLKGKGGAFTEIFNRGSSFPAGYVWLAEPSTNVRNYAWCQMLSDGDQTSFYRYNELPVLCVVR